LKGENVSALVLIVAIGHDQRVAADVVLKDVEA
jgi:hypothetical protein